MELPDRPTYNQPASPQILMASRRLRAPPMSLLIIDGVNERTHLPATQPATGG